jgi:hypothetical protein
MTNHEHPLEALCGERATVSAFTSGQTVHSWSEGLLKTGKITWMTLACLDHPLEEEVGLEGLYQTDLMCLLHAGGQGRTCDTGVSPHVRLRGDEQEKLLLLIRP